MKKQMRNRHGVLICSISSYKHFKYNYLCFMVGLVGDFLHTELLSCFIIIFFSLPLFLSSLIRHIRMNRKGCVDFPVAPRGVRGLTIKQNCYFSLCTQEPSINGEKADTSPRARWRAVKYWYSN